MLKADSLHVSEGELRLTRLKNHRNTASSKSDFGNFSAELEELTQGTKFCQKSNVILEMNKEPRSLSPYHIYLCDQFDNRGEGETV